MTTIGSLCTGAGMLDLAADAILGPLEHAWHADTDPAAAEVLAHHYPGVPNLGDITATDWTRIPPVDIITAGWPCQPWSLAGQRRGAADERAIWPAVANAIRDLRPAVVLLENVPAIAAAGELARATADLASCGYVGSWRSLRACDVGAPHRRERIFIVAYPADADSTALRVPAVAESRRRPAAVAAHAGQADALLKTPTAQLAINGGSQHPDKHKSGGHGPTLADQIEHLLPTPTAANSHGNDVNNRGDLLLPGAVQQLPRYNGEGVPMGPMDPVVALLPTPRATDATKGGPNQRGSSGDLMLPSAVQPDRWGDYAAAIARWEAVLGRPAPEPTEPGRLPVSRKADLTREVPVRDTNRRLAAPFVEWLMGLPAGWVTDHVKRNDALRILGNGVVWQQAAAAYALALGATS